MEHGVGLVTGMNDSPPSPRTYLEVHYFRLQVAFKLEGQLIQLENTQLRRVHT